MEFGTPSTCNGCLPTTLSTRLLYRGQIFQVTPRCQRMRVYCVLKRDEENLPENTIVLKSAKSITFRGRTVMQRKACWDNVVLNCGAEVRDASVNYGKENLLRNTEGAVTSMGVCIV